MSSIRRLHWTCGDARPPAWINADFESGPGIDIACDIVLDGLPLESSSVDYISSQHALDRMAVHELGSALRELLRVLKPGGVLRLGLADLDKAIDAYKEGRSDYFWCWDWKTLSGRFITQALNHNFVRTPLTYDFTEELLIGAGFSEARRAEYRRTNSCHSAIVELDRRPTESFYVEAVKPAAVRVGTRPRAAVAGQIHLSWSDDPSTTLTVMWHTAGTPDGLVIEYRRVGSDAWSRVGASTTRSAGEGMLHRATLRDLDPGTDYEYRVSNDSGAMSATSIIHRTRTAPPPGPADFTFAFICDSGISGRPDGNSTGTIRVIEELVAHRPLFVLGGGDYAYTNRDGRFEEVADGIGAWFQQMEPLIACVPFMGQYGNHEILLGERFRDWAPWFAHPRGFDEERNYSFDVGDAHFTGLFVPADVLRADQLMWLDADLGEARRRGMRWLIVYQHEPIFGHGNSHPATPNVRKLLAPVFEKHRVDLHLSGHDQNYERTYPLMNVREGLVSMSASRDRYEAGSGVIYAKVSPAGKLSEVRNDFSRFTTTPHPFIAARDDTAHHYALVTVRSVGQLCMEVFSVSDDETPGVLFDSFLIVDSGR